MITFVFGLEEASLSSLASDSDSEVASGECTPALLRRDVCRRLLLVGVFKKVEFTTTAEVFGSLSLLDLVRGALKFEGLCDPCREDTLFPSAPGVLGVLCPVFPFDELLVDLPLIRMIAEAVGAPG